MKYHPKSKIELPIDYIDLLTEFSSASVDFVLIGDWAVAVHGYGRATDDLDILVRPSRENAEKVIKALKCFGAPLDSHNITAKIFAEERYGYRIGKKPILIEILTTIDGVTFDEASTDVLKVTIAGLKIPVINRIRLLKNKRASGRAKDLADVIALENDS